MPDNIHECCFAEECTPEGDHILTSCMICGITAMEAMGILKSQIAKEKLEHAGDLLVLEKFMARYRILKDLAEDIAEGECYYRDNCPTFGTRHGQCTSCKAREALIKAEHT